MSAHPAPHAERVSTGASLFGVFGGAAAWYLQLCCGYALASDPCFREGHRTLVPPEALHWTWPAMVLLMIAALVVSLVSLMVSKRAFDRTRHETHGDSRHLMEVGTGRTRFLALWGIVLGAGFALATAITGLAFVMLPRCAG